MSDPIDDPVDFMPLPAGVQASYDWKMRNCKAGWQATGDPWAVAEAMTLTFFRRQPPPAWLDDAVWTLACTRRTKRHAKQAHERSIRFRRFLAVRDAHRDGLPWEKAYVRAAELWADSPDVACEPEQMRKAYLEVRKDSKEGRGGLYFYPKQQHRS
jgi:hypothetical protein